MLKNLHEMLKPIKNDYEILSFPIRTLIEIWNSDLIALACSKKNPGHNSPVAPPKEIGFESPKPKDVNEYVTKSQ